MKKVKMNIFFIFLIIIFYSSYIFAQKELDIPNKITSVIVFDNQAEITRSANYYFNEGEYIIKFSNLPSSIIDNLVRVNGSGKAEVKISGVKIETSFLDTIPSNKINELLNELKPYKEKKIAYEDSLNVLYEEKNFLNKIKDSVTSNKDGKNNNYDVSSWLQLVKFYDEKMNSLNRDIRRIERNKIELSNKIEKLENELSKYSKNSKLIQKNVTIYLKILKEGNFDLNLFYVLPGASWYPIYDIRVIQEDKKVEFNYYGIVKQNTGENWTNVKVKLSTSKPSQSAYLENLNPWYIDQYIPQNLYNQYLQQNQITYSHKSFKDKSNVGSGIDEESYQSEAENQNNQAIYNLSSVSQSGITTVFETNGKNTIISDGSEHKLPIISTKLDAEFEYSTIPKIKENAFLYGKIKNITEYPFISGILNIFFENNFVGLSAIDNIMPNEDFKASLGIDDGIKIKRQKIIDFKEEKGIFSGKIKKTFEYKITIENLKMSDILITVNDQFPISKNKKIEVIKLLPNFENDKEASLLENGIIEWKIKLQPKEKRELRVKFQIEYPADISVKIF